MKPVSDETKKMLDSCRAGLFRNDSDVLLARVTDNSDLYVEIGLGPDMWPASGMRLPVDEAQRLACWLLDAFPVTGPRE